MSVKVSEIGSDLYRISVFVSDFNLQFNHFLLVDDEPLLFHTGFERLFPVVYEGVSKVMDPKRLRWISFSHFEPDECGSLNQWLAASPKAEPLCSLVGSLVTVGNYASRAPRCFGQDAVQTGKYRLRYIPTPHLPHGWDAGVLFEETQKTLFCSDLFHQEGDVAALSTSDIVGPARETLIRNESSPFAGYVPYTHNTGKLLSSLAALHPRTLATMHGSSFQGDGARALEDLNIVFREVLGGLAAAA
jgi:flavorubredoxin